eukprot:scaffold263045_cov15-Tisochrysis_lutea.AAC.1
MVAAAILLPMVRPFGTAKAQHISQTICLIAQISQHASDQASLALIDDCGTCNGSAGVGLQDPETVGIRAKRRSAGRGSRTQRLLVSEPKEAGRGTRSMCVQPACCDLEQQCPCKENMSILGSAVDWCS